MLYSDLNETEIQEREDTCLCIINPGDSDSKESACDAGDLGSVSGLGRSPGEGNGNPLQFSCLENPMDGGVWQATVHGKSWIQLMTNTFSFTVDSLCCIGEMNITL